MTCFDAAGAWHGGAGGCSLFWGVRLTIPLPFGDPPLRPWTPLRNVTLLGAREALAFDFSDDIGLLLTLPPRAQSPTPHVATFKLQY